MRFAALMFAHKIGVVAYLALTPAFAADRKPDASIKSKSVDASVFLDVRIKADPALAADCLAEVRKWIDKQAADAEASRKEDPVLFRNGRWSFERKYETRSLIDGRYVSIIRSDYMDSGGAHPNSDVDTILWDATQKKRISIRPFFTETVDNGSTMTAMHKAVIASLNIEKKKRDAGDTATAEWYKGLRPVHQSAALGFKLSSAAPIRYKPLACPNPPLSNPAIPPHSPTSCARATAPLWRVPSR